MRENKHYSLRTRFVKITGWIYYNITTDYQKIKISFWNYQSKGPLASHETRPFLHSPIAIYNTVGLSHSLVNV